MRFSELFEYKKIKKVKDVGDNQTTNGENTTDDQSKVDGPVDIQAGIDDADEIEKEPNKSTKVVKDNDADTDTDGSIEMPPQSGNSKEKNKSTSPIAKKTAKKPKNISRKQILARAKKLGFDSVLYHASTHDIEEFDASKSHMFNDWGRGIYATNSPDDAAANYAGMGADLTSRIEWEMDNISSELDYLLDCEKDEYLSQYGLDLEDYNQSNDDVCEKIARMKLVGEAERGVVYPIMVNRKNMVVIDGDNSTKIPGETRETFYQQAKEEIDISDYDTEEEYHDAVQERVDELFYYGETSSLQKVHAALQNIGVDERDIEGILDYMIEYDVDNMWDLDRYIRKNNLTLLDYDSDSEFYGGAISASLFAELGYSGVIDKMVNEKFGTQSDWRTPMAGVTKGVEHTIVFPGHENLIRSVFAAFDPNELHSKRLMAADDPDEEVAQDPEVQRICELAGVENEE